MPSKKSPSRANRLLLAVALCLILGPGSVAVAVQSVLADGTVATGLMSRDLWQTVVRALGGDVGMRDGSAAADVPFGPLFFTFASLAAACWLVGAAASSRSKRPFRDALAFWGVTGWLWWLIPGLWEAGRLIALLAGLEAVAGLLLATVEFWLTVALAGWLATLGDLAVGDGSVENPRSKSADRETSMEASSPPLPLSPSPYPKIIICLAMALYAAVFITMNRQLYEGLLVPHGDSAMYEEHLWNVTHGKGFRSYLDQGLFLGEHMQVIHLLLLPLHILWPSHLLLEVCESLALASGALPVFWMARRHTGSDRAACYLAIAYLLYFPLQFLDIAIDLKTFRPISFGVPLLLFALDQMERGRLWTTAGLLLLALSAKEDYALVIAPLGMWLALQRAEDRRSKVEDSRQATPAGPAAVSRRLIHPRNWFGGGLAVFSAAYLLIATRLVIPWFRGGEEVHYARYFSAFGDTLGEIAWNMLTQPGLLADRLITGETLVYALALLVPLGFLPLFSPGRLAVGLPLFVILCLNEIARDPRHHFHAPLVPIVLWAAAAGVAAFRSRQTTSAGPAAVSRRLFLDRLWWSRFACASALASGLFFSISPLGIAFWDSGSEWHWRRLYVPGRRAELFPRVLERIPRDARVASTDFVHPRFTHYERSYDYSHYKRAVSGGETGAPPDTDYIVIDTQHPYSDIKRPEQIPEYRNHPDEWKLLPVDTDGYFIVLKRTGD